MHVNRQSSFGGTVASSPGLCKQATWQLSRTVREDPARLVRVWEDEVISRIVNLDALPADFSFTAARPCDATEIDAEFEKSLSPLERTLRRPLGKLTDQYRKAVLEHLHGGVATLNELPTRLREAAKLQNILYHMSWSAPDDGGASIPRFVDRQFTCLIPKWIESFWIRSNATLQKSRAP